LTDTNTDAKSLRKATKEDERERETLSVDYAWGLQIRGMLFRSINWLVFEGHGGLFCGPESMNNLEMKGRIRCNRLSASEPIAVKLLRI